MAEEHAFKTVRNSPFFLSAAVDTDDTQTGRETKAAGIQNPLAGKSEAEGRKRGDLARGQRSTFTQQLRPDRAY